MNAQNGAAGTVDQAINLAWHDASCPEGAGCRDRVLHARSAPLANSGLLRRFVDTLLADPATLRRLTRTGGDGLQILTPREVQVAALVAKGLQYRAIGQELGISPATVKAHIRRSFAKLEVRTRAEMVAVLMGRGLLK